ncbi:MAG: hypothetical protein IAE80_14550 [Anaerolinea sp.]|nr:hypothetical protein [Anaerolinea sp.]
MSLRAIWGVFAVLMALAACAPTASARYILSDTIQREDFDAGYVWEDRINRADGVEFRVEDGTYRARTIQTGFVAALNAQTHTDVVIEVETTQLSDFRNNAYGILCRADPSNNGNGYYFLISGDGYFSLRRGVAERVESLIEWTRARAINQDRGINRLRAVCIGDYLALYINGTFVGEARDSRYASGFAGLTAAVAEGGQADISFDDLTIWSARVE